jgi:Phosphatidylinositol N-acetylglucosaminyltransferase
MPPQTSSSSPSSSSREDNNKSQEEQQRFVWRRHDSKLHDSSKKDEIVAPRTTSTTQEDEDETYESLLHKFSAPLAPPKSLVELIMRSVVVGQEFVLTCFFLARHRVVIWEEEQEELQHQQLGMLVHQQQQQQQHRVYYSHCLALAALMIIAFTTNYSSAVPKPQQSRKAKVLQRVSDAIFLALFLRIEASVLQTLTASFSTDTVERLTMTGMIIHLFTCDYSYANGNNNTNNNGNGLSSSGVPLSLSNNNNNNKRPTFHGGTVSLNAAFFSTILLASRLKAEATLQVYIFVASAIILFAFFPDSRHAISQHPQGPYSKYYYCTVLNCTVLYCLYK